MSNDNSAAQAQKISTPNPFMKIIKSLLLSLIILLILLVAGLFGLLASETGSLWLVQTLASKMDQLDVTEVSGTLLNELNLKQVHFKQSDNFSVALAKVKLHWHATELLSGHLHIAALQVEGIEINGKPASEDKSESSHTIPSIPISISIDDFLIKQVNWINEENHTKIHQLSLTAALFQNKLNISRLKFIMPQIEVNASSEVQIQSDWPIKADLNWSYYLDKEVINGQINISGDMQQFNFQSAISGLVESKQNGFIKLTEDQPEFNLNSSWQKLQWPLTGTAQFLSQHGSMILNGNINAYQSRLNADIIAITAATKTSFALGFRGQGNQHSFAIEQLQLKPTTGSVDLKGKLSWDQAIVFNLDIAAKQLNPAIIGSDIPANINLQALSQGNINGDKISVELDIKHLTGSVYDQPLNAQGKVNYVDKKLSVQTLQIIAGNNKLTANGQVSEQNADLNLIIAAADLKTAWPTLAGSINGKAQITGSLQKPTIKTNLQGQNIHYQDQHIGSLSITADYQHDSDQQSTVKLIAKDIQLAEHQLKQLNLQGHGNQSHHQLDLTLQSSLADLIVNVDGYWKNQQYSGQIKQLIIEQAQLQKWQLQSPADFFVKQNKNNRVLSLSDSCLVQNDARLCLSAQGSPEKQLDAKYRSLPGL